MTTSDDDLASPGDALGMGRDRIEEAPRGRIRGLVSIAAFLFAAGPVLGFFYDLAFEDLLFAQALNYLTHYIALILIVFLGVAARMSLIAQPRPSARAAPARLLGLRTSWIFLAVIAWMMVTTVMIGPDTGGGIFKIGEICLVVAVGLAVSDLAKAAGRHEMLRLWRVLAIAVALTAVAATALHISMPERFIGNRTPAFIHIRMFGFSLAAVITVFTAFLAGSQDAFRKTVFWLVLLTILWAILFWTASRGGIVSLVVAMGISMAFIPRLRRIALPWSGALGVGFLLSLLLPGEGNSGALTIFQHQLTAESMGAGRLELWAIDLMMIADRPWTGFGYAQHLSLIGLYSDRFLNMAHTHNIVLESLLAIGMPGTVLLAAAAIAVWIKWLLAVRKASDVTTLAAFLVVSALYAYSFMDGVYFYPQSLMLFALAAGVLGTGVSPLAISRSR